MKMNRLLKNILIVLLLALLGFILYKVQNVLIYLLVSGIISLMSRPGLKLIDKIPMGSVQVPNWIKSLFILVVLHAVVVGLGWLIVPQVVDQAQVIQNIDLESNQELFSKTMNKAYFELEQLGVVESNHGSALHFLKSKVDTVLDAVSFKAVFGGVFDAVGGILIAWFSIVFISFFFIKEEGLFKRIILNVIPTSIQPEMDTVFDRTVEMLSRYFVGLSVQLLSIATLVTAGLYFAGIENALLIGFFAGFINIIPYVGPIFGFLFGLIVALLGNFGLVEPDSISSVVLTVVIVFGAVQVLDNLLLQPFIFSNSVAAHPLEIFLVISAAGTLGGVGLMVVAIPLYTFLRVGAKEFFGDSKIVKSLTKDL